jgi:hypothetical protein
MARLAVRRMVRSRQQWREEARHAHVADDAARGTVRE